MDLRRPTTAEGGGCVGFPDWPSCKDRCIGGRNSGQKKSSDGQDARGIAKRNFSRLLKDLPMVEVEVSRPAAVVSGTQNRAADLVEAGWPKPKSRKQNISLDTPVVRRIRAHAGQPAETAAAGEYVAPSQFWRRRGSTIGCQ